MSKYLLAIHRGHNASCAVMKDGKIVMACEEERFSRVKNDIFTSNYHLEALYQATDTTLWHAIGSDLLVTDDRGLNPIQRRWTEGSFIWENLSFLVIPRSGYPVVPELLPKQRIILQGEFGGSSTDVRKAIQKGEPFDHLVDAQVHGLIMSKKLYR
jgi:nicotinic acid mononucleotide adenylyltransferase